MSEYYFETRHKLRVDPSFRAEFLNKCLESYDDKDARNKQLMFGLRNIVSCDNRTVAKIAKASNIHTSHLYKLLRAADDRVDKSNCTSNPTFDTFLDLLDTLDVAIQFVPKSTSEANSEVPNETGE